MHVGEIMIVMTREGDSQLTVVLYTDWFITAR
jgi:hypothetical protein